MKISIYNAISIDGFIADSKGKTEWVSEEDWLFFEKLVKDSRAIVMGSTTYKESGDDFPYNCELNIVMTSQQNLLKKNNPDNGVIFTNKTPKQVIKMVKDIGYDELLVIGGGKLNASFIKAGYVNEVIVDIHPLIIGSGVKLFDSIPQNLNLTTSEVISKKSGLNLIKYLVEV